MLILFVYCLEALDVDTFLTQKLLSRLPSTTPKLSTVQTVNLSSHESSIPLLYIRQVLILLLLHPPSAQSLLQPNPLPYSKSAEQLLMALRHNFNQIDQLILRSVGDGEDVGQLIE